MEKCELTFNWHERDLFEDLDDTHSLPQGAFTTLASPEAIRLRPFDRMHATKGHRSHLTFINGPIAEVSMVLT